MTRENPFLVGDPVMDAAQGRPMIVLDAPETTVAEWSERNNYDLQDNYANGKFDPDAEERVVECVYVSDVRSEPSKTYTFPASRVVRIDAHHADDGRRVYDRVGVDVLRELFAAAFELNDENRDGPTFDDVLGQLIDASEYLTLTMEREATELADVERRVVADE